MAGSGGRTTTPHVVQVVQAIDRGGLEMMAVDLAVALRERGLRSTVVGLTEGGRLEARLVEAGVPFHLVGDVRYVSPKSHMAVGRLLRRLRPTVLHTHHLPSLLNVAAYATVARVRRVVHTEHARMYLDEEPHLRRVFRLAARIADVVALVGGALTSYYTDVVRVPARRLRVVPNGVDTGRFRPVPPGDMAERRRTAGLLEGAFLVGAVGRLAPVKNYELLLHAAARTRAAGTDLVVALIGDGEERERLERLADSLGLRPYVQFLGWRRDVADVVGLFDALAVTSHSEALPLVVLEAMSAGVPVVSTAVGEIPRVLQHGLAGTLVPPGDLEGFAGALQRIADDPEARRATAARARQRVEREYSLDAMVDAYVSLYGLH